MSFFHLTNMCKLRNSTKNIKIEREKEFPIRSHLITLVSNSIV